MAAFSRRRVIRLVGAAALTAPMLAPFAKARSGAQAANAERVAALKAEIVRLARSVEGRPDPDFKIQNRFDPLIEDLLLEAAPPPLTERLDALAQPWRQIWGPYDYRGDSRGVDPDFAALDEIYQVVFRGGYYYNVTPLKREDGERIGLLRGDYRLSERAVDTLRVRFTAFRGARSRPADRPIWSLAADAEAGRLANEVTIVPRLIVRLFFGGGALREVYTDDSMRIAYGADSETDRRGEALYVMERADL